MSDNIIHIHENDENQDKIMRCPFRTKIFVQNEMNESGLPIQTQTTTFPECHYNECPFYNPSTADKCTKISSM